MPKSRIGLDIGSTAVRAAELSLGDNPSVLRVAQVPLPAGAVDNGEVREPEAVSEALRQLWDAGGFKTRKVWLGVGNQRVVVREISLPYLPEKELRSSLGFQVQEFIPMSVDDAVLDFDTMGEFEAEGRKMVSILLVAAQRVMVDKVVQAALGAKIEPVGLDLIPFALVRAVGTSDAGLDLDRTGDEAIVDIGAHVTNIVVHSRGQTRFVRILPSGGRDITLAISHSLGIDDEIAERLKRGEDVGQIEMGAPQGEEAEAYVSPPETGGPAGTDPASTPGVPAAPDPDQVRQIAMRRASSLIDEIRSSLEFYGAQSQGGPGISKVLVSGGGSKLPGFLELLAQRSPVPVEAGRVFQGIRSQLALSDEVVAEAEPVLAVAVGLALPGRNT
ncbi:MAG: type IV pilus assembly protein PilM [Actinomycetota bacterium]|nr:type IV pilus assembly protein PilM [Actinomycetota bacterium]